MERVEYEKLIIQDLLNMYRNKELDLNPWYQRRSVWTNSQKSYLINTLFEQMPIPSIYIRHSLDLESEKSIKEVVDGQQRIRAIIDFVEGKFSATHPRHHKRVKYNQLNRSESQTFKLTSLSIGSLLGATESDVIEIFGRLNSVSKVLNAQEKRNAKYSGEFKQFCLRQAASRVNLWRNLGVFSANDIARMVEVQFISDLVLNFRDGLTDYSNGKLGNIYSDYDEKFGAKEEYRRRLERVFKQIVRITPACIEDTIFSRQPIFFSLCVALDARTKIVPKNKLEAALYAVDNRFNSDTPPAQRSKVDAEFYAACTSSTQRIKSRKIRDKYINKFLGS